jgi:hypothetical protein
MLGVTGNHKIGICSVIVAVLEPLPLPDRHQVGLRFRDLRSQRSRGVRSQESSELRRILRRSVLLERGVDAQSPYHNSVMDVQSSMVRGSKGRSLNTSFVELVLDAIDYNCNLANTVVY